MVTSMLFNSYLYKEPRILYCIKTGLFLYNFHSCNKDKSGSVLSVNHNNVGK